MKGSQCFVYLSDFQLGQLNFGCIVNVKIFSSWMSSVKYAYVTILKVISDVLCLLHESIDNKYMVYLKNI